MYALYVFCRCCNSVIGLDLLNIKGFSLICHIVHDFVYCRASESVRKNVEVASPNVCVMIDLVTGFQVWKNVEVASANVCVLTDLDTGLNGLNVVCVDFVRRESCKNISGSCVCSDVHVLGNASNSTVQSVGSVRHSSTLQCSSDEYSSSTLLVELSGFKRSVMPYKWKNIFWCVLAANGWKWKSLVQ
jgi:hypothetical protein